MVGGRFFTNLLVYCPLGKLGRVKVHTSGGVGARLKRGVGVFLLVFQGNDTIFHTPVQRRGGGVNVLLYHIGVQYSFVLVRRVGTPLLIFQRQGAIYTMNMVRGHGFGSIFLVVGCKVVVLFHVVYTSVRGLKILIRVFAFLLGTQGTLVGQVVHNTNRGVGTYVSYNVTGLPQDIGRKVTYMVGHATTRRYFLICGHRVNTTCVTFGVLVGHNMVAKSVLLFTYNSRNIIGRVVTRDRREGL